MSVIVNGSTFETLSQPIYLSDGRQVQEIWVDGKKVYPDDMTATAIRYDDSLSYYLEPEFIDMGEIGEAIDYSGAYIYAVREWIDANGKLQGRFIDGYNPIPVQELTFQDKYFKANQFSNGGQYYIGTGANRRICRTAESKTVGSIWYSHQVVATAYASVEPGMSYCFLHGATTDGRYGDYFYIHNFIGSLSKTSVPKLTAYFLYGDDITDKEDRQVISGSFRVGKHTLYYSYADLGRESSSGNNSEYDFYTDGTSYLDDEHKDYESWIIPNSIQWRLLSKICGFYHYYSLATWEKYGRTYTCLVRLGSFNSQNIK